MPGLSGNSFLQGPDSSAFIPVTLKKTQSQEALTDRFVLDTHSAKQKVHVMKFYQSYFLEA